MTMTTRGRRGRSGVARRAGRAVHGAKGTRSPARGHRSVIAVVRRYRRISQRPSEDATPHVRTTLRVRRDGPRDRPSGSRPASTRPTSSRSSTTAPCRKTDLATWDFRVYGEVDTPFTLTWDQFKALPRKTVNTDIHCVTRWTKLDTDVGGRADPGRSSSWPASARPRPTSSPTPSRATPRTCRCRSSTTMTCCWPTRSPASRSSSSTATRSGSFIPKKYFWKSTQVDPRPRVPRPRPARLLGALRLPQRRRPLEGRALQRVAGRALVRSRGRVSRIRTRTTSPEAAVIAPDGADGERHPGPVGEDPARTAPIAKPRSRHSR